MNREQFLHITHRYLLGTLTEKEEKELLKTIESSEEYKTLFKQETAGWTPPENDSVYNEKWKRLVSTVRPLERPEIQRYTLSRYTRVAAVAAIFIVGGLLTYWLSYTHPADEAYEWVTLMAETDDQTVWLPDSSSVYVRKGSQLTYFRTPAVEERIVRLEGEAFFDVRPDTHKPFRVEAGELHVTVSGTSFSVDTRSREEYISVILVEGKVGLYNKLKEQLGTLAPGQQADFSLRNGNCTISEVDSERMTRWRKGIIEYENIPIEAIMELLSTHYATSFEWELPDNREERFSGAFLKTQPLPTVIEQIEKLTGAKIRQVSD